MRSLAALATSLLAGALLGCSESVDDAAGRAEPETALTRGPSREPVPQATPAPQLDAGTLRVRVVGPAGEPIAGAKVLVVDEAELREVPTRATAIAADYRAAESGETDGAGVFLAVGLGPGPWRVWAGKRGWLYVFGEAFELASAGPGRELELATRPVPEEQRIRGTVTDPVGKPTFAFVLFVWRVGDGLEQRSALAGHDGVFEVLLDEPGLTGALVTTTNRDRFASRVLEPVSAGTHDVAVRLTEARRFELDGREPDGAPVRIETAHFYRRVLGAWLLEYPGPQWQRDRAVSWAVPDVPFRVVAQRPGYESAERIVDDPAQVLDTLTIDLVPLAHVAGIVEAGGRPVPGACVRIEFRDPRPQPADVELDDPRSRTWPIGSGRSDATGAFSFPTRFAGRMRVFASHAEHGQASVEVDVDAEQGATGLVLALDDRPLGAIEGHVIPPGDHTTGEVLLDFDGPGAGFYIAPDATGWFRASGVASGTWAIGVMPCRDDPHSTGPEDKLGFPTHFYFVAPEWLADDTSTVVELAAGETKAIEIDLATPLPCRLAGSARVDGGPMVFDEEEGIDYWHDENRHVFLDEATPDRVPDHLTIARDQIGADGRFHVATAASGVFRLRLELAPKGMGSWTILDRVQLESGEARWSLDLRTGSVRVRTDDPGLARQLANPSRYRWRGPGEMRALLHPRVVREDGACLFHGLPAGRGEVFMGYDEPRVIARFDVEAGRTIDVELP